MTFCTHKRLSINILKYLSAYYVLREESFQVKASSFHFKINSLSFFLNSFYPLTSQNQNCILQKKTHSKNMFKK